MKLKVFYGDVPAIIVEDGQMLTLSCANLTAKSDIVIETISDRAQVPAPSLSIDGSTLTISDMSGAAEVFVIYSNGSEVTRTSDNVVDLSTIVNIQSGIRSITVVAQASGYNESELSEAVEYRVGVEISGTWLINEFPLVYKSIKQDVEFSSASRSFSNIKMDYDGYTTIDYDGTAVYLSLGTTLTTKWTDEKYRYVTFDGIQLVSPDFHKLFTRIANPVV